MIFESHAHYDDEAFDEDRDVILSSMQQNGIGYILNIGSSLAASRQTIELAEKYPFVYGAVGVHPDEVGELDEEGFQWLKKQCSLPKIKAVGEIGLDYYWNKEEKKDQQKWFERQMELAREEHLPVVIHSRDAAADTLEMMKSLQAGEIGGVMHCFSYGKEMAKEYLEMGFYLGIGGVVTFKNARKVKEVVAYMPLESLLLETDCPYLAPAPHRGKRNSSLFLPLIAREIADIKGISYEEVVETTNRNAKKLFFGQEVVNE